jgi:hypothetical protein
MAWSKNIRKVSSDLAEGGEYTEGFGLSILIGTICRNLFSNKIVREQKVPVILCFSCIRQ